MHRLSPKQADFVENANARINIAEGSVSGGKSYATDIAFLKWIRSPEPGEMMILGRSAHTIKRNIIMEYSKLLGHRVRCNWGRQEVTICDRLVYIVGATDERAVGRIQGATLLGALVDEASLLPEAVWNMLMSRLRLPNARLYATTNPDSPYHWLKTQWIDRQKEIEDIKVWQFRIDDNPSLTETYKNQLKREYVGLWYKRYIDGQWVLAEGTVYDFFNEAEHVIPYAPPAAEYYVVGVDYGTVNPTVFSLIGYNRATFPNMWLESEYYWDSTKRLVQKTDAEYVEDLQSFIRGKNVVAIYVDPAAASFKQECYRAGITQLYDANNDVLSGIRYVSTLMKSGTFRVCRGCSNTLKEFGSYVWDETAAKRGEDKPKKQSDHCFVADTMIATPQGERPIQDLRPGDMVITRFGPKRVLLNWKSQEPQPVQDYAIGLAATQNHRIYVGYGWIPICAISHNDWLCRRIQSQTRSGWSLLYSTAKPIDDTLIQKTIRTGTTSVEAAGKELCIGTSGNFTMGRYRKIVISTTKMAIPLTIALRIWNASPTPIIVGTTPKLYQIKSVFAGAIKQTKPDHSQLHGMEQKKDWRGIVNMANRLGNLARQLKNNALNVARNFQTFLDTLVIVPTSARVAGDGLMASIMWKEPVPNASKHLLPINIASRSAVPELAEPFVRREHVYNLTIEDAHEYFANGVLVKNCMDAMRYGLMSHFFAKSAPSRSREELDAAYREEMFGADYNVPAPFRQPSHYGGF